jgi:hypothetical protein
MRAYGFVDWSGDAGFKFALGSSTHFVMSLISSADEVKLRHELAQVRAQLSLPQALEFHFAHNAEVVRAAFFAALPRLTFDGAVLVVDKRELPDEFLKVSVPAFYGYFLAHLLMCAPLDAINVKRLLIDDRDKANAMIRGMRIAVSPVFRARQLQPAPRFRGEPAHQSSGLQVADMLAGAMMEKISGDTDYVRGLKLRVSVYHYT